MTGSEVHTILNSCLSLSTLYTNEVVFMPQLKSGETYLSILYRWEKMEDCQPEPASHLSQSLFYAGGPGQGRAGQGRAGRAPEVQICRRHHVSGMANLYGVVAMWQSECKLYPEQWM